MIEVVQLYKAFQENEVLKGISLRIKEGSTVAIIGPSGSGKSTFLRCLNLLEHPDRGTLRLGEYTYTAPDIKKETIRNIRKQSAMVFQNYNLFYNKTVLENITLALKVVKKWDRQAAEEKAEELLAKVGLLEKRKAYPVQLSGGQKQRVAIARALALNPRIMLYDEPTSSLDPELVAEVLQVMKEVAKERVTSLIVTHEMQFARDVADWVVFMDAGEIVEQGKPEIIFQQPKETRTKQFLKKYMALD